MKVKYLHEMICSMWITSTTHHIKRAVFVAIMSCCWASRYIFSYTNMSTVIIIFHMQRNIFLNRFSFQKRNANYSAGYHNSKKNAVPSQQNPIIKISITATLPEATARSSPTFPFTLMTKTKTKVKVRCVCVDISAINICLSEELAYIYIWRACTVKSVGTKNDKRLL